MSKNDVIVLQANFENWTSQRADGLKEKKIDPWLYYCLEQFLKPYGLSDDEIQYGITDGGHDGGADAIYFLVNHGVLVTDEIDLSPKSVSRVRVIFIQVKKSGGFKATEIDKLVFLTDDFFDLSKDASALAQRYNPGVLKVMKSFKEKYLKISGGFPDVVVDYYYITGDDVTADGNAHNSAARVRAKVNGHLSKATANFTFAGAAEIWAQVQQRPARDKFLVWSETPMSAKEGWVGLVKLKDFYEFLLDGPGILAERIFESNVRGYQVDTPVNIRIRRSLQKKEKANF